MVITIDGPVASGKSTVAKKLAERTGFFHLSSGLLFRALAYLLTTHAGYTKEELHSPKPSDIFYYLDPSRFICTFDATGQLQILFEGEDIVPHLKQKEIDQYASILGTNETVREAMLGLQRAVGQNFKVIVDGRDSGSVVFPDAIVKFFLTASLEVRAQRWQQMQASLGNDVSMQEALKEVQERDERDKSRKISPLVIPEGGIVIDSSGLSIQETVDAMMPYVEKALKNKTRS